jgi:hypothetical protein
VEEAKKLVFVKSELFRIVATKEDIEHFYKSIKMRSFGLYYPASTYEP